MIDLIFGLSFAEWILRLLDFIKVPVIDRISFSLPATTIVPSRCFVLIWSFHDWGRKITQWGQCVLPLVNRRQSWLGLLLLFSNRIKFSFWISLLKWGWCWQLILLLLLLLEGIFLLPEWLFRFFLLLLFLSDLLSEHWEWIRSFFAGQWGKRLCRYALEMSTLLILVIVIIHVWVFALFNFIGGLLLLLNLSWWCLLFL